MSLGYLSRPPCARDFQSCSNSEIAQGLVSSISLAGPVKRCDAVPGLPFGDDFCTTARGIIVLRGTRTVS